MTAMRRTLSWSLALPLAVVGSEAGHELGYRIAVPSAHERAHMLERSGHGYFEHAPLVIAAMLAVLVLGFAMIVVRLVRGERSTGRMPVLAALLLPALVFLGQEHAERFLQHHALPWDTLAQPAVLVGLVLQAPVALVAAALAGHLTRLAERVARALCSTPPRVRASTALWRPAAAEPLRPATLALGYAGRGPPGTS
jgi:hypothetical protein